MKIGIILSSISLLLTFCTSSAVSHSDAVNNDTISEFTEEIISSLAFDGRDSQRTASIHDDIFDTSKKITLSLGDEEAHESIVLYTYYGKDQKPVLVRTNNRFNSQTIYDYETKELIDTHYWRGDSISANKVVPHGIDTIFSFTDGSSSHLSCKIGNKYFKKRIPMTVKPGRIEQKPSNIYPCCLVNGKWYFPCRRLGEYPEEMKSGKDRLPILELDTDLNHYRFFGEYPELYAHNNMGTVTLHWEPTLCRSSDSQHVIVGFSATPDIYVYDPATDQAKWVTAKSEYVDSIPLPFTAKGRDYFSNSESYYEFAQYSHYGQIIYDKWKDVYYRFVGLGLNNRKLEYHPLIQNEKAFVIMVMDKSFNVIGEQYIGNKYNMYVNFVTPDGLFIESKDSNEDRVTYNCFKLKER